MAARILAGYRLEERMAVGGMAEIFRAVRTGPGEFRKSVAIKMVLPDLSRDPQFVQMFLQEAQLGAKLSSPHLVQVFDFGEEAGTYYLVMEFVDGVDLASLLALEGRLPLPLALHLGHELCSGLSDLHTATDEHAQPLHIVHRDVNPGNVLLSTSGDVKLGDFGIAKARARSLRTERGAIKGKLAYLSPEQVRGEEVDARADLYAVGLVLFEAVTGQRYLLGDTEAELLQAASQPSFRAPSRLRAELPAWLDEVLARVLAPEPARRYPDAKMLREALRGTGLLPDAAELRRELGLLVSRGRRQPRLAAEESLPLDRGAAKARSSAKPTLDAGPRTEVLDSPAKTRPHVALWLTVLLVAAAALAGALTLLRRQSDNRRLPVDARPAAAATLDSRLATRVVAATMPVRPLLLEADAAAAKPHRRAGASSARPRRRDAGVSERVASHPADRGAPPGPGQALKREALAQLAELDRMLQDKGILAEDAPKLFAERQTLARAAARGEPDVQSTARLLRRARELAVDRAFVDSKLARITSRLARAKLDASVGEELKKQARRALSYAVTGRYTEANRDLNVIHRRLEGR